MKPPTAMALWALLLLAPALRTSAAPPPELILIRTQFDKAVTERVEAPHAAALDELTATYGAALDRAISASKAAGDLESVVALEEEKGLIEQGKPVPAAGVAPAPLAALRPIYLRQLAVIEEKKRVDHLAVLTPYLATLRSLEATLTKTDRIEEAKEILAYRKSVETSSSVSEPVAVAATPSAMAKPAPSSGGVPLTVSGAPTPQTDLPPVLENPDAQRIIAEWALQSGHEVRIRYQEKVLPLLNLTDLPKEGYEVFELRPNSAVANTLGTPLPWETLAACEFLTHLALKLPSPGSLEKLQYLGHLENLTNLDLNFTGQVAGPILTALPPMPQVKLLIVWGGMDGPSLDLFTSKYPRILNSALYGAPLSDEAFAAVSRWRQVDTLRLDGFGGLFPATPAKIATLADLPKLERLVVYNPPLETISPQLAAELTRIKRVYLNHKCSPSTLAGFAALPSLEELTLSRIESLRDGDLAPISNAKKLKHLILDASPLLTPAALDHIASSKSLEKLTLIKMPAFTETHLAAFREKQRDVEIVIKP